MKYSIQAITASIVLFLLQSCGKPTTTAGFGSETTNGGTGIVVALTGVESYRSTKIQILPSDYNPVADSDKNRISFALPNEDGKARVYLKEGVSYSIFASDEKTGKKVLIQNVIIDGDTTISGELEPTGELQVNFVNSESMLDTANGYISIDGYPDFADEFIPNDTAISVVLEDIPQSLLNSVRYGVKTANSRSQLIGDSVQIQSDSLTQITATLYYRFLTKSASPLLSDTVTVVSLGREPGLVWIGTNQGITRYKNKQFISRTAEDSPLEDNLITAVCESSDTVTWFGTINGLTRLTDSYFNTLTMSNTDFLPSDQITTLASTRESMIWIGTNNGLALLTRDTAIVLTTIDGLPSNRITSLEIASNGTLWVGTDNGACSISPKMKITLYTQETLGGTMLLPVPLITDIEITKDGVVWIATAGGGILTIDNGVARCRFYPKGLDIMNYVTVMQSDKKGNIWFGTKAGILLKNVDLEWFCYLDEEERMLPDAEILSFAVDNDENFYCGTLGKGLFLLGPSAQNILTTN